MMRIEALMTRDPVCVGPQTPVEALVDLLVKQAINGVPVVDEQGALLGMVTSGDLIHRVADQRIEQPGSLWQESLYRSVFRRQDIEPNRAEGRVAAQVMTPQPHFVTPTDDISVAARLLIEHGFQALPVVEAGRLVGILSRLDLLRCLRSHPECHNPLKASE